MQALLFLLSGRNRLFFIIKFKDHMNLLILRKTI